MPLYSYRCPSGHESELRRSVGVDTVDCQCGKRATRLSVYRFSLGGPPTPIYNAKDYVEASDMIASQHAEAVKREGVDIPAPQLWQVAKKKAAKLMAQGATDSSAVR